MEQAFNQSIVRTKLLCSDIHCELVLEDELVKYLIAFEGVFTTLGITLQWHVDSFTAVTSSIVQVGQVFELAMKTLTRLSLCARSVTVNTDIRDSKNNFNFQINSIEQISSQLDNLEFERLMQLVANLGWEISFYDSDTFKGLCISVIGGRRMPYGEDPANRQIEMNNLRSFGLSPAIRDKYRPCILVAESNSELSIFLKTLLSYDFEVLLVDNGLKAFDLTLEKKPDIVLCDVFLQGLNGLSLARRLSQMTDTAHIPIMFMSGLNDIGTKLDALSAGGIDYLKKPFLAAELLLKLHNHIHIRYSLFEAGLTGLHFSRSISASNNRIMQFKQKVDSLLHSRFNDPSFCIEEIAEFMCMSGRQLQRKFKDLFNKTPNAYLLEFRTLRAFEMLSRGKPISVVADFTGFSSVSYFSKCFKLRFGMNPSECSKAKG
ncbi:MAG: response regulator transcription factor [Bacteroidetes bacterium]|nr:response regulator transcription factor [Bacteroidota bacterium]